jgi:type II secretory pathway pseudopilin PulG
LKAEKLLETNPDSSYLLLSSISQPEKLSKVDYAAWCLQYTYAQFKLQKEVKSDTLLKIAVRYFEKTNLPKYSGTSYYLLGYFYSLQNKNKEALVYFKKAEKLLKGTTENNLNGLVEFHIGSICSLDELYNHSLTYFNKSVIFFHRASNKKYEAYAYREISDMYFQLHRPFDSIMYYSNIALKLAAQSNDSINYYCIMVRQGELLYDIDYHRSKEYILRGYSYFPQNKPYNAAYLAFVYSKLNKSDSAKYYLNVSLTDTANTPYKIIGLYAAALIAKNGNDYKKAYHFLERSYLFRDSTYQQNIRSQLYRIDKQYDSAQKEKEITTLKIASQTHMIWITILVIAVLSVLLGLLLITNIYKKKDTRNKFEKQQIQFEAETAKMRNLQKQDILRVKLLENISNTLEFNNLKRTYQKPEKQTEFYAQLAKQAMLSEGVWQHYIDQTNYIFDNRIEELKIKYTDLSKTDLIVIVLICLKVSILDSFMLLDMSKNTMYKRRKTIKKRLDLGAEVDLDKWILDNINLES